MDVEVETQMRVEEEHERPGKSVRRQYAVGPDVPGAQLASTGVIPSLVHDAPTPTVPSASFSRIL